MDNAPLPDCFCWTRFGTEGGEEATHILNRKEQERVANGGVFLWGIGNAIGPSIQELVRRTRHPEVLFSPIKSSPKPQDVQPPAVAVWVQGETMDGHIYHLPQHSLVTSRYDPSTPRSSRYALVCFSVQPLITEAPLAKLALGTLRNLRSGRPIGSSQVTAVVLRQRVDNQNDTQTYDVVIRAKLVYPYFVRLRRPVVMLRPSSPNAAEGSQPAFEYLREERSSPAADGFTPPQMSFKWLRDSISGECPPSNQQCVRTGHQLAQGD
jgi:hypothetical protein